MESLDAFVAEARATHPTDAHALTTLRKLGSPPKSPNPVHPGNSIRTALRCIAALARNVTLGMKKQSQTGTQSPQSLAGLLRRYWPTVIGEWVVMFLEHFIPEDIDSLAPSGSEERGFLDLVHGTVPKLILFPFLMSIEQEKSDTVRELKRTSPNFSQLLVKAILFEVQTDYFKSALWCFALYTVLFNGEEGENDLKHAFNDAFVVLKQPVSRIYIRHIHEQCDAVKEDPASLRTLQTSMSLLQFCIHSEVCRGAFRDFNANGGPAALTRLLSTLTTRSKTLKNVSEVDSGFWQAYEIVEICVHQLKLAGASISPFTVVEIVDAGVIPAILSATRFLRYRLTEIGPTHRVSAASAGLLKNMTIFFCYPLVVRRVVRAVRKAKRLGIDWDDLPAHQTSYIDASLRKHWRDCKAYALEMYGILQGMMNGQKALQMCQFSGCHRYQDSPVECQEGPVPQYVLCSSCLAVSYCSRACAKQNWRNSHRNQCQNYTVSLREEYVGYPSSIDRTFWGEFAERYIEKHKKAIFEALIRDLRQTSNRANPGNALNLLDTVVVLNLCTGNPYLSALNFTISNIDKLAKDKRMGQYKGLLNEARSHAHGRLIVVMFLASIGKGIAVPWVNVRMVDVMDEFYRGLH